MSISNLNAQGSEPTKKFNFNLGTTFFDTFLESKNIYAGFDYKITESASVGLMFNHANFDKSFNKYSRNEILITLNQDWSGILGVNTNKFDIYTGINMGNVYYNFENTNTDYSQKNEGFDIGGQVGIRYFVYKNFGLNTEIYSNLGKGGIRTGITYKF